MAWDIYGNYITTLVIGSIMGVIATRYFYEKTKNYSIGKTIESALISGSIDDLLDHQKDLEQLLAAMRHESNTLMEQIKRCGDIESLNIEPNENGDEDEITSLDHERDDT